ncbi:MAG: hypothetical protein MRJ65_04365 [Candidatus Brocadiaceae bacterium]|nr:hypothetical protein [Candidatus Brocadiaceae bacterium]
MSKNYYVIENGEIHPFNCYKNYSTIDALVAYANTEEHAMELATMYERGEIQPITIQCEKCGSFHEVLQETGE